MKNNVILIPALLILIGVIGCNDATESAPPSTVGWSQQTYIYHESDPQVRLVVKQSEQQFAYTQLDVITNYVTAEKPWQQGEYFYWGDSVYVMGGYHYGAIDLFISDDDVADGNDTLDLELVVRSGNVILDGEKRRARVIVIDDEGFGPDKMNIHAYWWGDQGPTRQPEVDYDIDLYLLTNVIETSDGLEDFDVFEASAKVDVYEDIFVNSTAPDQDYYILAYYNGNSRGLDNLPVEGRVSLSGFGYNDKDKKNFWKFDFKEVGYYSWRGPFRKVGKTFVLKG